VAAIPRDLCTMTGEALHKCGFRWMNWKEKGAGFSGMVGA
jgi:hypothetical protein